MELTLKRLKETLLYDEDSGVFKWKATICSRAISGETAGTDNGVGYIKIAIDNTVYYAHRLAWFWVNGYFPEHGIDHINRNKKDNSIKNLREISQQCNARNCDLYKNNTSGIKGVFWEERRKKWRSTITVNRIRKNIGYHSTKIDAAIHRWLAEKKYGFTNCETTSTAFLYLKNNGAI